MLDRSGQSKLRQLRSPQPGLSAPPVKTMGSTIARGRFKPDPSLETPRLRSVKRRRYSAYAQPLMTDDLGPWRALGLGEVVRLFGAWRRRWWISGGVAFELHLGRSWRDHDDSDVSILRGDATVLHEVLAGWDIELAASGVLTPWDGSPPSAEARQNNLWCREAVDQPWCLDLTISDGDDNWWIYRRDPTLRVPWADAVLMTEDGIPYLAPELQLLFKSEHHRTKDERDATEVIPALTAERQRRLRDLLPRDHPWQALIGW